MCGYNIVVILTHVIILECGTTEEQNKKNWRRTVATTTAHIDENLQCEIE